MRAANRQFAGSRTNRKDTALNDAQHPLNALPQGHRLQEYELVRVLGFGGFGMTYLGFDHNLDKGVAVKEYLPADIATRTADHSVAPQARRFSGDYEWGLDRFLDEARILARFDHRNIIKVYRFFEAHGTAYIVMEYAEGETLSQYLERKQTMKESDLKEILYPVLDGLEEVHGADFLHRDVKPGNIILRDEDRSPVLLDFGAARQVVGARSRSVTSIITPGYAPIEQYSSRGDQGPWTDIYALGAVCYHALTGDVPDDATDRVRDDPLVPVAERCAGQASAEFLAAIDRALKVDEGDRPQSVAAWRTALSGETPDAAKKPRPVVRPAKGRPPRSGQRATVLGPRVGQAGKRKGPTVAAVVCVLALLMGGGYYYYENIHRPEQLRLAQEGEAAKQVSALLSGAAEDLAGDRLTSPAGNNAWEKYQAVLALAPAHEKAIAGLDSVIGRYVTKFDASLAVKEFDKADEYVSRVRGVWADAPVLAGMQDRVSASRLAERRRLQAEQDARLAAAEAERLRLAKVAEYKGKFEESLGRKDIDTAVRYVESLRSVNASAQVLSELEGRLSGAREAQRRQQEAERLRQAKIELYMRKFEETMEEEALDKAGVYVDSLRAADAADSLVSGLERRLSSAREEANWAGRKFRDCAECPEMVVAPSGSFWMGSHRDEGHGRERPRHRVRIGYRFAVGVYEVTFPEWDACANGGGCGGYQPDDLGWGRGNRPVINVSWDDAQSYVRWLSQKTGKRYRLLSESEWEYVARAGTTAARFWGESSRDQCRYSNGADETASRHESSWTVAPCDDGYYGTSPAGNYKANAFGLHDALGNVWEWTQDCWNDSYSGAPSDGSAWGRGTCGRRVLRGGSWLSTPRFLRSAGRNRNTAGTRDSIIGFRVARTITP